jgi:hypothetical protein
VYTNRHLRIGATALFDIRHDEYKTNSARDLIMTTG